MAADPKIVALQAVLNRYPSTNPTLVTDGLLGDKTAAALLKALNYIASSNTAARDTALGLASKLVTASGGYNFIQIRSSAEGLTTYLNDRADDAKLTVIQTNFVASVKTEAAADSAAILAHNQQNRVAAAAMQATQNVPPWAMYTGGAVLIIAAIGATALSVHKKKKRGGSVPASAIAGAAMNENGLTWTRWWRAAGFSSEKVARATAYYAWKRGEDPSDWRASSAGFQGGRVLTQHLLGRGF